MKTKQKPNWWMSPPPTRQLIRWGIAAVLLGPLLAATVANAQLTNYDEVFRFNKGFDTWTIDSVTAYISDGDTIMANLAAGLKMMSGTGLTDDSLTYVVQVSATTISKARNPSIMVCIWPSTMTDRPICETRNLAHLIHSADSARNIPVVSTSVSDADWAVMADTLRTEHGAGAWTSGTGGTGAFADTIFAYDSANSAMLQSIRLIVRAPDTATLAAGTAPQTTVAAGYAIFALDAETYPVNAAGTGYAMSTAYELETVAANQRDTVFMFPVSAASPSAANLTAVTFNFFDGTGDSIKNVVLQYNLDATDVAFHYDSTKIIDPSTVFEARSDASGQVTINIIPNDSLYLPGYREGQTKWKIKAFTPEGKNLLGNDGIKIEVPASATGLTYPKDWD